MKTTAPLTASCAVGSQAVRLGFGIDIGGSGIKGAPVDLDQGVFAAERLRIPTPKPSTPHAVVKVISTIVNSFDLPPDTPIGVTFPGITLHGVLYSAWNMGEGWLGFNLAEAVSKATGHFAYAVNDADAAGYAETVYGAAKGQEGVILVVTLGTGIGTALISDGHLVPNLELGHVEINGKDAESRISDAVREHEGLSWQKWAKRLQNYFAHLEFLLSPDLFVIGGGVSKKHEKYVPFITGLRACIVPAQLRNDAGIVGAAVLASTRN